MDSILKYWFGDLMPGEMVSEEKQKMWFDKNPEIDRYIRDHYEKDVQNAADGGLDHWQKEAAGRLALVLLLDQFTRNIYRNTPDSFAYDEIALHICTKGIQKGMDVEVHPIKRVFFYLPMMHAEDLDVQKQSIRTFKSLLDMAPSNMTEYLRGTYDFAVRHHDIVKRFGRFPHRNEILGRKSTKEEIEFLKTPQSSF